MPREVTAADVERALAQWPTSTTWDRRDRDEMRDALEADDLAGAMQSWMPYGDGEDRTTLAQIRQAHAQGWPGEVPA